MEPSSPSRGWREIDDPAAARMVTDPRARRYLEPLLGQERTVGRLAGELGVDISSALYRVRQFLRLGLVEVVREESRRGRAIRHYRAVADGFYVPFAVTPHATPETLAPGTFAYLQARLDRSIAEAWTQAAGEPRALGIHVYRNEGGHVSQNITPRPTTDDPTRFFEELRGPDAPAVWDTWGGRRLGPASAKRLQRELAELLRRYPAEDVPGARAYTVRLAMAPQVDVDPRVAP